MFDEEWFSLASQTALAALARSTDELAGDVVEVGSWQGRSTCALARAVHPAVVHAVDTWEGSPGEVSAALAVGRDVFAEWSHNVATLTAGNVQAHRMGWREYFEANRAPVRFCFIDATHTYREVRDNLEAVMPLMVAGGVVCGDDAHHPPVMQAVIDVLGGSTIEVRASLWIHRVKEAP